MRALCPKEKNGLPGDVPVNRRSRTTAPSTYCNPMASFVEPPMQVISIRLLILETMHRQSVAVAHLESECSSSCNCFLFCVGRGVAMRNPLLKAWLDFPDLSPCPFPWAYSSS